MNKLLTIVFVAFVAFTGCKTPYLNKKERRAVRTIKQSQNATDSVIRWYLQTHPRRNDTVYRRGKDTTIIRDTVIYDSIPLPYPVNHKYTEVRYKDRLVRDTVEIKDQSFTDALERRLQQIEKRLTEVERERDEWKSKARERFWIIVSLTTLLAAIAAIAVYLFLIKQKFKIIKNIV